jgi:hypothetical protein
MAWRPKVASPTWRSFLRNHLPDIAAIDIFVVVTAAGPGQIVWPGIPASRSHNGHYRGYHCPAIAHMSSD